MNTVLTFLDEHRERLDLERYDVPERLTCVLVTPRFRASAHVVFVVLPRGTADPVLVAKMPRLGTDAESIAREVANLRRIQGSRVGGFRSIPRVVAYETYRDHPLLVETALVGRPMDQATIRKHGTECCTAMTNWLIEVQQATKQSTTGERFRQLVEETLRQFETAFPMTATERTLLDETRALVAPLYDGQVPMVFEHGDLSHPNLFLLADGGAGVVDWELADPTGVPAYDLFFFLTYVAFARQQARVAEDYVRAFHNAFFSREAWTRTYVQRYVQAAGIAEGMLTPLFVLCWARYVTSQISRLTENSDEHLSAETAAWVRRNRYYVLWQHTIKHVAALDW